MGNFTEKNVGRKDEAYTTSETTTPFPKRNTLHETFLPIERGVPDFIELVNETFLTMRRNLLVKGKTHPQWK